MTQRAGWKLRYLYVGTSDVDADLTRWRAIPGARVVWDISDSGDRVAALDLGAPPFVLLADHRPPPSVLPVYVVDDLAATTRELASRGWKANHGPFEIPEGPCTVWKDESGNEIALLQITRPGVFEAMGNR